jgi:hypothetical protein
VQLNRSSSKHLQLPRWLAPVSVAVLVLASSFTCLGNTWVQDDVPIIKQNALLHTLARPWTPFTQAYWPLGYSRDLYRPFTSLTLAIEWVTGGGHPLMFRIISILLYLGTTLAVYRLARRLVSPGAAWLAAAWFAVHPLHAEAVAVAVNQAELVVAALLVLLMTAYIDRRRSGTPMTGGWIAAMTGGFAAALLFKEHAILLPALMVAAELTVIRDPRPWRQRLGTLRLLFLALLLVAVAFVGVRTVVLHGNTKGSFTAEALEGLGIGGRSLTMLGVVPTWFRLFFWPEHLRADYSPQEIVAATRWGFAQTLGAALLILTAVVAWVCRRTRPQVTFAILWSAIGISLVSNILFATGIVVAERTLFLSSIGVVIAGGDLLWAVGERIYARSSVGRILVATGVAVLLAMGASRSASRQTVWRDGASLWFQTVIDAPLSYRAHHAYGSLLFEVKMEGSAEKEYRRAIQLYPEGVPVSIDLGDKYRVAGHCEPAIREYQAVLRKLPNHISVRASEVACLLYLGRYREAAAEARLGASYGYQPKSLALYAEIADSAERVHAPLHSINLPPPVDSVPKRP